MAYSTAVTAPLTGAALRYNLSLNVLLLHLCSSSWYLSILRYVTTVVPTLSPVGTSRLPILRPSTAFPYLTLIRASDSITDNLHRRQPIADSSDQCCTTIETILKGIYFSTSYCSSTYPSYNPTYLFSPGTTLFHLFTASHHPFLPSYSY